MTQALNNINRNIIESREAVEPMSDSDADKLHQLGLSLHIRYEISFARNVLDLQEAIECHRKALFLRPAWHSECVSTSVELAALMARFEKTGNLQDLEEAMGLNRSGLAPNGEDDQRYAILWCLSTFPAHEKHSGSPGRNKS